MPGTQPKIFKKCNCGVLLEADYLQERLAATSLILVHSIMQGRRLEADHMKRTFLFDRFSLQSPI